MMNGGIVRHAADPRHPNALPIRYGATHVTEAGTTADLSHGGLFIITKKPMPKSRKIKMLLDLDRYTIPLSGQVAWGRFQVEKDGLPREKRPAPIRTSPISIIARSKLATWSYLYSLKKKNESRLSANAKSVVSYLLARGASFFNEILLL